MKALVGCEFSGVMRDALRRNGWDAYSCDLLPCEADPRWHIQDDLFHVLASHTYSLGFDLFVCHPDCQYAANSGVKWLYKKGRKENGEDPQRWADMEAACEFWKAAWSANARAKVFENPIPHGYALERMGPYTQVIQPWQHGHPEKKATCLWLENVGPFKPTNDVRHLMAGLPKKVTDRVHYASPGKDRWKERARTLPGVAAGLASQLSVNGSNAGGPT